MNRFDQNSLLKWWYQETNAALQIVIYRDILLKDFGVNEHPFLHIAYPIELITLHRYGECPRNK